MTSTLTKLAAGLALLGASYAAQATTYTFSQGDYFGGGTLNGYFTGTDSDGDGLIYGSEVQDFKLSYTGSSIAADAEIDYTDYLNSLALSGLFAYVVGSNTIGYNGTDGLMSLGSFDASLNLEAAFYADNMTFGAGGFWVSNAGGNTVQDYTLTPLVVTQVPEPASLALVGLGACALLQGRRKTR